MKRIYSFTAQLIIGGFLVAGCKSDSPTASISTFYKSEPSTTHANIVKEQHLDALKTQDVEKRRPYEEQRRLLEAVTLKEENPSVTLPAIDASILQSNDSLTIKLATEEIDTGRCYFAVRYPQVEGLADTALEAEVNADIRRQSFDSLHGWDERDTESCSPQTNEQQFSPGEWYYLHVQVDYCRVAYARERLLSVRCQVGITPGANGFIISQPFTIDLATGHFYDFPDLFNPDTDYPYAVAYQIALRWMDIYSMSIFPPVAPEPGEAPSDREFYVASDCTLSPHPRSPEYEVFDEGETCFIAIDSDMSEPRVDIAISINGLRDVLNTDDEALAVLLE